MDLEPQCLNCENYRGQRKCRAYLKLISDEIYLTATHDHRKPFPGDNGIQFEPEK